jgi:hypothetical protein
MGSFIVEGRNSLEGIVDIGGSSSVDCCTQLICADCLCECLGGDLISCC